MRKKIVAGNWKMNKSFHEGIDLTKEIIAGLAVANHRADAVILCPPSLHVQKVSELCHGHSVIGTGAQNCHSENSGAFTGEISAGMIASVGANYVILGHSERRLYNGETDELLTKKVNAALMHGLKVIFCCGESVEIRNSNQHIAFVNQQLAASLFHLSAADMKNIVIAYEPIWAIGTGVTASKEQAQEMHAEIRKNLATGFGDEVAENTSVLYGGSCNAQNAKELFEQADVDGGLIGGASLKATDFIAIISSF